MIHPHSKRQFINDQVGDGVVATAAIPAGTILWTLCDLDMVMPPARVASLSEPIRGIVDVYGYVDQVGDTVLCWDDGRYVNHSCEPAMFPLGPSLEICVRDLQPGDELTCEYGTLNYVENLACHCGARSCRGLVRADDALAVEESAPQRLMLERAVARAAFVPQPLLPFVRDSGAWAAYLDGRLPIPDISTYYFAGVA